MTKLIAVMAILFLVNIVVMTTGMVLDWEETNVIKFALAGIYCLAIMAIIMILVLVGIL